MPSKKSKSAVEDLFEEQLRFEGIAGWAREVKFHPTRRWRFDFAFEKEKMAVEIEGGVWKAKSRHTSGIGFTNDCEKYAEAMVLGWRVLRVTSDQVRNGKAIQWLREIM
jgi:very-short-patch-repair endonuclease